MTKELIRRKFQSSQIMPWRGGSNLSSLEICQSESGTKGLDRSRYAKKKHSWEQRVWYCGELYGCLKMWGALTS